MRGLTGYKGNIRLWLKGYLFFGVAVMTLAMFIYSNHLIGRMRINAEATTRMFSRYFADHIFEVADDGSLAHLHDAIRDSDLPIIITVLGGRPIIWHNVPVAPRTEEEWERVGELDVDNPYSEKMARLIKIYRDFDHINPPIPIQVKGAQVHSYVHYGRSPLQRELRMMPFVELAIFLIFMTVAIQGVRYLKLSEERSVWVGMAKETAHQLGTPLSAMLGWTQVIREQAEAGDSASIQASLDEMEVDLRRLNKVTDRFSKIGSMAEPVPVDLGEIVSHTAEYFEKRMSSNTRITTRMNGAHTVRGNAELLEWVFENLVKNALDAIGDRAGEIEISHENADDHVDVFVRDTGRGIPQGMRDRIFRPGFTTKPRGWGLGLALTRRIVEDYHRGSIRVVDSRLDRGTTILVRLPV